MSASPKSENHTPAEQNSALSVVLIAALLVAFFAAWPLLSEPGFLNTRGGGDSPFLLQRLQQLEHALRDAHFPVRWMPDANYGFGYPFFNYYAPLSIYVAALFRFLGFSIVRSLELAQLSGFLLAAAGVFLLARRWYGNDWGAFLASVAYTMAPFHLVNVYVRGDSLAEFWAMALYPWVILTADFVLAHDNDRFPYGRVAALAIAYAALILSHNISALIFTPFLMLFILLRWFVWRPTSGPIRNSLSRAELRPIFAAAAAGLLALALAAWFFLPALVEQNLAQLDPVTGGYFHYSNHFRAADLVQRSPIFDYDVSGGAAFRMGLVQAAAALAGTAVLIVVTLRGRSVPAGAAAFIVITLAAATFMITPLSQFLWDNLPLLPFAQFPWRFLSIQAFAAALAIGALALLPYCRVLAVGLATLLIVAGLGGLTTDELIITDADISAEHLAAYEWFTGNIGSTVSAEYLPQTVEPRVYSSDWLRTGRPLVPRALDGDLELAEPLEQRTVAQTWQVETGEAGATVMMPTLAWPGWEARLDEQPVAIEPTPGTGLISVAVPPGDHLLSLRLARTPIRLGAEFLSLAALVLTVWLLLRARPTPRMGRPLLLLALAAVLFLIGFRLWPEPAPEQGNLTWDFAQMAYLHRDVGGTPFNSGTALLDYAYGQEDVAAGEALTITLRFSEPNNDVATLALGTPALVWPLVEPPAPPVASATQPIDQETVTFRLFVPDDAPAGMVVPRLTLDVGRPLLPSGAPRGDLFLRPLRISNESESVGSGADLEVRAETVTWRDDGTLDVQLAWRTAAPLHHNYVASLLLIDDAGNWLAQLDTQPGYGFLPSSEWPVETTVHDWLALGLPANLPSNTPLTLVARLYEAGSGELVLTRRLGDVMLAGQVYRFVANEPAFAVPAGITPLVAEFDKSIRLLGYDLGQQGPDSWQLTLYWQALEDETAEALRFAHVYDPRTEEIVSQVDGHALQNSYPADQWTPGEIISDTFTIDLSAAPPGEYRLGAGWYNPSDGRRLRAIDPQNGDTFGMDRVQLPDILTVER